LRATEKKLENDELSSQQADKNLKQSVSLASSIVSDIKTKSKGATNVTTLRDDDAADVTEWISSGIPSLDKILGGGWAISRCSEVYGKKAGGKSALADLAIRSVQAMGGLALVYEFERTRERRRMVKMGIDPDRVVMFYPQHADEAFESITQNVERLRIEKRKNKGKDGPPVLIIFDSIGQAMTKEEYEAVQAVAKGNKPKNIKPARIATLLTFYCKPLAEMLRDIRAHLMYINQARDLFGGGAGWGPKEITTPGGNAKEHAMTVQLKTGGYPLKDPKTGAKVGLKCYVETVKNKVTAPFQRSVWVLDFEDGPSPEKTAFFLLQGHGVIKAAAAKKARKVLKPGQSGKPAAKAAADAPAGSLRVPWFDRPFLPAEWGTLMRENPEFNRAAWEAVPPGIPGKAAAALVGADEADEALADEDDE
jgi:RecA/RadA recombinase